MMRALWTGASGMKAQQTSMDNISNNLANINTTGFKKETVDTKPDQYTCRKRIKNKEIDTTLRYSRSVVSIARCSRGEYPKFFLKAREKVE